MDRVRNESMRVAGMLGLACLTLALFWPVCTYDFINFDDPIHITQNPQLKSPWVEGCLWAFTTPMGGMWHPLTSLSHWGMARLFGLDPAWHHGANLFLHLVNTLLLFAVFQKMTGALWRSAAVAALFAVHPLHVESVAWVSARKDVLSTFFWMMVLWFYYRYACRPSGRRYGVVVLFFILGLLAKPSLMTLPFVLLVLDWWPLRRFERERVTLLLVEKIPLLAMAWLAGVISLATQHAQSALVSLQLLDGYWRLANAVVAYAQYIWKFFWPAHLAIFYPHPGDSLPLSSVGLSLVLLLAISAIALAQCRKAPYLAVGWLWFLGTLLPMIGLVQIGSQAMADRYTYIALIGLFVMLVWGLADILSSWPLMRTWLRAPIFAWALALIVFAGIQVGTWRDSIHVMRHAVDVTTDNWLAHSNLGSALVDQGQVDAAIVHFKESLIIMPESTKTLRNLKEALLMKRILREKENGWEGA